MLEFTFPARANEPCTLPAPNSISQSLSYSAGLLHHVFNNFTTLNASFLWKGRQNASCQIPAGNSALSSLQHESRLPDADQILRRNVEQQSSHSLPSPCPLTVPVWVPSPALIYKELHSHRLDLHYRSLTPKHVPHKLIRWRKSLKMSYRRIAKGCFNLSEATLGSEQKSQSQRLG